MMGHLVRDDERGRRLVRTEFKEATTGKDVLARRRKSDARVNPGNDNLESFFPGTARIQPGCHGMNAIKCP